ncbi:MAG: hypothetical protein SFU56_20465 [Capsulimonadales bacterium]|nr:hypothetical protein [Capsulimonadales bacterium]
MSSILREVGDAMTGQASEDARRTTRRAFLRDTLGGAAALSLGGSLLTGCGSRSGSLYRVPAPPSRMLVSTFLFGTVESYDPGTFRNQGTFAVSRGVGISTAGIVAGSNNNVFVFSPGGDAAFMYDKGSGAFLRSLPTPPRGLITPHSGVIGPDGFLYVVNAPSLNGNVGKGTDSIERYDARTGDRIGTFAPAYAPFGIIVNPRDRDFYVSSTLQYSPLTNETDFISRLNGETGRLVKYTARDLKIPFTMAFHPSGDLLVVEHFTGRVVRYDLDSGSEVGTFATCPFPVGITYGPDGDLYVGSFTTPDRYGSVLAGDIVSALGGGSILRFDGNTGQPRGAVVSGLPFGGYVAFV